LSFENIAPRNYRYICRIRVTGAKIKLQTLNSILAIALILLALPSLALLTRTNLSSNLRPNTDYTNDIPLTPDVADLVGQVNVSSLPVASGGLDGQVNPLPLLLPSQSVRNTVNQGSALSTPAFTTVTLQNGASYLHVQKAIAGTPGTNPNPCKCSPPDMGLAASDKFVVQMVNLAGSIYRTSGSTVSTFALTDFWFIPNIGGPLGLGMSDPQVLYNARAGHWFADIIGAYYVNRIYFAVSATSDPTGVWYIYRVVAGSTNVLGTTVSSSQVLPDQPWIGYSDDKFLIAANDFAYDPTFHTAAYFGAQYWILNSAEMFAGARFIDLFTNMPDPSHFRIDPTGTLSPTTTAYMAENCLTVSPIVLTNQCPQTSTTTGGGINVFAVTGTPPGPVNVVETTVPITQTNFPSNADQPSNPGSLATNDNRLISAVWQNNLLWTTLNDGCSAAASCVRLDEIQTPVTASSTPLQDFDFDTVSGTTIGSTFYGAVSTDTSNDLVVVYATSSSVVYPTLQATSQLSTSVPDTLSPSRTIAAGTAADLSTRYGDYFYAATQPNVPATFWVSGEYRTISLFQGWSTEIGLVTV
jgi:hypothetical protein